MWEIISPFMLGLLVCAVVLELVENITISFGGMDDEEGKGKNKHSKKKGDNEK